MLSLLLSIMLWLMSPACPEAADEALDHWQPSQEGLSIEINAGWGVRSPPDEQKRISFTCTVSELLGQFSICKNAHG